MYVIYIDLYLVYISDYLRNKSCMVTIGSRRCIMEEPSIIIGSNICIEFLISYSRSSFEQPSCFHQRTHSYLLVLDR